jgi:membrane-associated phospholipid phosphatase
MKTVYNIISLYEFLAINGLILLGISSTNTYLLSIGAALYAKQIPEKLLKFGLGHSRINQRPFYATDCNMINEGGFADAKPGFPSGHSTVAAFIATLYLMEFIARRRDHSAASIPALVITLLFAVLVPFARIQLGCHTPIQVVGGMILGIILALVYYKLDTAVFCKNTRYLSDKNRFYNFLNN